jgi:polyferredoxin
MASKRVALPVVPSPRARAAACAPASSSSPRWWSMGKLRALSLLLVHVLVGLHIWHYLSVGRTLSPLEPSESGQTLTTGVINAGALCFALLIASSLVFGRFFCGWACHLVAYQDLARWLLLKLGVRPPRPPRSRLLPLVPLFAVYWLFGRPLVAGWRGGPPRPSWDLSSTDLWATFPGPWMTAATVVCCGFLIVYLLGAKGFCTYACPYGVFFGVADRVAPGRIRVTEDCTACGVCTTVCSSNVQVAREVRLHGMVVDSGCMKCMDCVTHCPTQALYYGWGPARPRAGKARREKPQRTFDLTWSEELFAAGVFAASFAIFFNLHRSVPFLLSVGLGAMTAVVGLQAARLATAPGVELARLALKRQGRITAAGRGFLLGVGLLALALVYGGWVQWHTQLGERYFDVVGKAREQGDAELAAHTAALASAHLEALAPGWVLPTQGLGRMLGQLRLWQGRREEAVVWLRREVAAGSRNPQVSLLLGNTLRELGRPAEAHAAYRGALRHQWASPQGCLALARSLASPAQAEARFFLVRGVLDEHPADTALTRALCRYGRTPGLAGDADVIAASRGLCPG